MAGLENEGFSRVTVDGQEHARELIVLPDRVVADWCRREGHSLAMRRYGERGTAAALHSTC